MVEWDKHGVAQLAEYVDTRGEDESELLEIQRREVFLAGTNPPELLERTFDISIYCGDRDMTFHGLTARKVCQMAEDMIRLVGGSLRVDPPTDPEIKF